MNRCFCSVLMIFCCVLSAQEDNNSAYIDVNYFKGNIALHNKAILHLIKGHPEGVIIGWNKRTFGEKDWEQRFNYPDYGLSFSYQNLKNDALGQNYSLLAHYNFYFLNRNLVLRIGQGLALTTNPYDKFNNPKNVAFGSALLSSTLVMINYKKERIFDSFGLQGGLSLLHYSNANVKAPNTSVNTIALNLGITYDMDDQRNTFIKDSTQEKYSEPLKYNLVFRGGINESDVIDSGQYPFYILSAYTDKRISHTSAIQFGTDVFFSEFLKELIYYQSVAFPELDVTGDEDYRRVGLFIGHELFINRISFISQLGYYIYYPFDFEGRTYFRIGLKHYFNKKWFAAMTLKSHGAKAEAIEFGLGIRL